MASAGGKMLSAEERRRQKELEEARKAGLAAPEVDEEGNAINPHIPQFMASAPWYLSNDHPSLKHQKNWKGGAPSDDKSWYDRGAKVFQATKYRKGACENCGSMSHKTKDCMERPRSKGAKWTNKNIAADEKVQNINLASFDAKRDRWNGYSADEWTRQAEKFDKIAEIRAELRQNESLDQQRAEEDHKEENEEDKVQEEEEAGFATIEKRVRASGAATGTVRNLRIREDTAKYLLNLDLDSAHYDPKSRSMREDPNPDKDPSLKTFAGDNFVRQTGGEGFNQLNLFSVTAYERGQDTHLQATPSQAEAAFKAFQQKKAALQLQTKSSILEKYGSAAEEPSEEVLALHGTEAYIEYDAAGRVIRGQEVKVRSKYEEDVHPGNHTSVWGSWWSDGQWGYACCHQTIKNAYCTGKAGQDVAEDAAALLQKNMANHMAKKEAEEEKHQKESSRPVVQGINNPNIAAAGVWGTDVDTIQFELDEDKLKQALKRADREDDSNITDDRKRRYNSAKDTFDVTPEDMEAYRIKKSRGDDPLLAIEAAKAAKKLKGKSVAVDGGESYDFV